MGTSLTGQTKGSTYDALLKITDNGPVGGSLKTVTDGLGGDTALQVSTAGIASTGTLAVTGATTLGSTLGVTGASALAGVSASTIATTGNVTVGGTLGVTGQANLNGNAAVAGTLSATGAGTFGDLTTITSNASANALFLLGRASDSIVQLQFKNNANSAIQGIIGVSSPGTMTLGTGPSPTTAITISATQAVRLNSYGAGALVTDSSGNVTATTDLSSLTYLDSGIKITTSGATSTSPTLTNIFGSSYTLVAGAAYAIDFAATASQDASLGGFGFNLTASGGLTFTMVRWNGWKAGYNGGGTYNISPFSTTSFGQTNVTSTGAFDLSIEGRAIVVVNAGGTLDAQWCNAGAAGTVSLKAGSYMKVQRLS